MNEILRSQLIIWTTILFSLLLSILVLPDIVEPWGSRIRPPWVALTVIYWSLALPQRSGLFTAWLAGLLLDVVSGSLMGAHAFALAAIIYLVQRMHLQLRIYPVWQQSLAIAILLLLFELPLFWVDGATGTRALSPWRWAILFSGAIFWPAVHESLRYVRRRYAVN